MLGDEGFVQYQDQADTAGASVLGEVSSLYLDLAGTFVQGGGDTIALGVGATSLGTGSDTVIAGLGDDTVTIGDGANVVLGDEGGVTYQMGSGLRGLLTSRYLDEAGFAPLDAAEAVVGNDTITTGTGADVVIGGLGVDAITVTDGDNVVLGDEGFVQYQDQADTAGVSVPGEAASLYLDLAGTFVQGGIDTITTGMGDDTVVAGLGDDVVTAGDGANVVLGDEGGVTYQMGSGLRGLLTSRYLDEAGFAPLDAAEAVVGNDTITTGTGADVVIGGLGVDAITVTDGDNVVLGDEGFVQYQDQADTAGASVLGEVSSLYLDLAGTFVQGGGDTIALGVGATSLGTGSDTVIAGLGDDTVTIGDGDNIVLGDEGRIVYQPVSGLRGSIESPYLDAAPGIPPRSPHDAPEAAVGNDLITTGVGDDVAIGGLGDDTIAVSEGDNVVFGDEGEIHYQDQSTDLASMATLFTDGTGSFVQGGDDTITTGSGTDYILTGSGSDRVTSGDGIDTILGEGELTFHPGTNLPLRIASAYQDDNNVLLPPSDSVIFSEGGDDIVLAGSGNDWVEGGTEDDLLIGDEGVVTFDLGRALSGVAVADFVQTVFYTPDGQLIPGGTDVLLGQDDDDIVIGGSFDDLLDGGSRRDMVFGNNVTLDRRGRLDIDTNPRLRALLGAQIYTTAGDLLIDRLSQYGDPNWDGVAPFWADFVIAAHDGQTTWDGALVLDQDAVNRTYGDDHVAGGSQDDMVFGQRGDDTIQGDGSLFYDVWEAGRLSAAGLPTVGAAIDPAGLDNEPLALRVLLEASRAAWPGVPPVATPQSYEALDDGDDYIEGGQDDDLIFGNLGQDDIIGGNSALFGLGTQASRADGSDLIFGGAATNIARNDLGDATIVDGRVVNDANAHSRDADVILGDNGNIYRLVNPAGPYLTFSYDQTLDEDGSTRGTLRIVVRGVEWTGGAEGQDYTPGGAEFDAASAQQNIGAADEIHGEAGDDTIYGLVGDDLLFGQGQDDDLIGGYGHDWISGGAGQDGVLGDDGLIYTSRNDTNTEPLYGITGFAAGELDVEIRTPGGFQQAIINVSGALKKTVNLTPFNVDPAEDPLYDALNADDIIYGGLGDDFLHGGSGDDAISGAEALPQFYAARHNPGDILGWSSTAKHGRAGEFAAYNEYDPLRKILVDADGVFTEDGSGDEFLLNFDPLDGGAPLDPHSPGTGFGPLPTDGDDVLFGDLGNDWLVGGTGRDNLYGGWGDDLMNADDDHDSTSATADPRANNVPDTHPSYEDRAYGGAGRDILLANTGGDRLIDWAGEFNSYLVPFAPFGMATVSRALQPQIREFLYDLSANDGADPTRPADTGADPARNGEPEGELGLVMQKDFAWQDQTGAPDDPQPGNIPGGARDVLRGATFNNGKADGFAPDSGTWTVEDGRFAVAPEVLGGDAVSVFYVDALRPSYFEMLATINADKDKAGYKSNAYLIFDYQSPTDFKFAGVNPAIDKLQMGHRDADGWQVDVQSNMKLWADRDYNITLAVHGTTVTMVVDNDKVLVHVFAPRVIDGYSYGLNTGMVGIGANNSKGRIDNVAVQVLPPEITLEMADGFAGSSDPIPAVDVSGVWSVDGGLKTGQAGADPGAAVSLIDLGLEAGLQTSSYLELTAALEVSGQGGLVFDYYGPEHFKFVAIDAPSGQVLVGHSTARGGIKIDAVHDRPEIVTGAQLDLTISVKGTTLSIALEGQVLQGYAFNGVAVDGGFGLISLAGLTAFGTLTVKTNDPAFAEEEPLAGLVAASEPATISALVLTQTELDLAVTEATARWAAALPMLDLPSLMQGISFAIADLQDRTLGLAGDGQIHIDANAAGHGWFVDATASEDAEFSHEVEEGVLRASANSDAYGKIDLLTVVMHEMGHIIGLNHPLGSEARFGLMSESLEMGFRLLPRDGDSATPTAQTPTGDPAPPDDPAPPPGNGKGKGKG